MDPIGDVLLLTVIYVLFDFLMLGPKGRDWRNLSREVGLIESLYPKHYIKSRKLDEKILRYRIDMIPRLVHIQLNIYCIICILSILPLSSLIVFLIFSEEVYYLYATLVLCAYPISILIFVFYSTIIEIYLVKQLKKQRKEWARNHRKTIATKITKDKIIECVIAIILLFVILLVGGIAVWLIP